MSITKICNMIKIFQTQSAASKQYYRNLDNSFGEVRRKNIMPDDVAMKIITLIVLKDSESTLFNDLYHFLVEFSEIDKPATSDWMRLDSVLHHFDQFSQDDFWHARPDLKNDINHVIVLIKFSIEMLKNPNSLEKPESVAGIDKHYRFVNLPERFDVINEIEPISPRLSEGPLFNVVPLQKRKLSVTCYEMPEDLESSNRRKAKAALNLVQPQPISPRSPITPTGHKRFTFQPSFKRFKSNSVRNISNLSHNMDAMEIEIPRVTYSMLYG